MTVDRNRRRLWFIIGGLVLLGVLAFGAFALWFLRDDAPDAVSLDAATAQVGEEESPETSSAPTATTSGDAPATTPATGDTEVANGDVSGNWTVDTSIGEFSFEDSTGTFVGFRIAEELSGIGSTEAVGRTPGVTGTLVIDGTTISDVDIEADMTAITTNDSRRDDNVQRALDTDTFPTATFALTEPIELDESALAGEPIDVDALGELTVHGVTQQVTFPLRAQIVDDTIVVVGSLDIVFADYGVTVPSAPIIVSVEDRGPIELQLFFTR